VDETESATRRRDRGRDHRAHHNQYNLSHLRAPATDHEGSAGGLHPASRIWLQERGAHVFGPGAQALLHRLDQAGSLNRAAKDIGMSYSKAWRMIDEIERGLGIALLERHAGGPAGGGSRLTEAGRLVLERFEAFARDTDHMLEDLFHKHFDDLPFAAPGDGDGDSRVDLQPARERGGSLHEGGRSSGDRAVARRHLVQSVCGEPSAAQECVVAKVRVKLPLGVTHPEPRRDVACEGGTVEAALQAAIDAEPRLGTRLYRDGRLCVGVFVNDRNIASLGGLATPLCDGDVIRILPPISGG
jgi:molybdate transport system regulatory protein